MSQIASGKQEAEQSSHHDDAVGGLPLSTSALRRGGGSTNGQIFADKYLAQIGCVKCRQGGVKKSQNTADVLNGSSLFYRSSVLVVLEVEVLGEGPVDELGEEDLATAVLVDRVELWSGGKK